MARKSSSAVATADPAKDELTEKERRLVQYIIAEASEGRSPTKEEAGTAAGYGTGESARVSATRALARDKVRTALTEAARQCAQVDAVGSYAVLRKFSAEAESERVRLDAAMAIARIGGLDTPQMTPLGPGVVLNLMIAPEFASLLAQPAEPMRQATVLEGEAEEPIFLEEEAPGAGGNGGGGGGLERPARKATRGAKTRAKVSPTGPTHDLPPKKSRGRG